MSAARSPILPYATYNSVTAYTPPDDTPTNAILANESGVSLTTEDDVILTIDD